MAPRGRRRDRYRHRRSGTLSVSGRLDLGCPDLDALIQYRDGTDPPARRKKLARHIAQCDRCLAELERLRAASETAPEDAPPDLLQDVLAALEDWEKSGTAAAGLERLAEQIQPYLGERATKQLLQAGPADRAELLGELEPVLAQFLGRRAAAQLISRVLDRLLART